MGDTILVLNRLQAEGTIGSYAITGAVAAFRYIEPMLTEDLDLIVSIPTARSGLAAVAPIFSRLKALGYAQFVREGLVIEGWPVQFLPVASDLDAEALTRAEEVAIPTGQPEVSVTTRSLRAEHVVATAVKLGRPKDYARIQQFLENEAIDLAALRDVIERHDMIERWRLFCFRTGLEDALFGIFKS